MAALKIVKEIGSERFSFNLWRLSIYGQLTTECMKLVARLRLPLSVFCLKDKQPPLKTSNTRTKSIGEDFVTNERLLQCQSLFLDTLFSNKSTGVRLWRLWSYSSISGLFFGRFFDKSTQLELAVFEFF